MLPPPGIPLARPGFDDRELEAVRRVLDGGWLVQGPEVEAFERALAELHQVGHAVAVSSGTAALHLAFLAIGVGPGDAVFVPSFAWPSAANVALLIGARPVFVDVLPGTFNLDPDDLRRRIGACRERGWGRPRVLVPVHEFGLAADLDRLLPIAGEHGLEVIEDAACALGARYHGTPVGRAGRAGVLSFHPRKSITTGEGGALLTGDAALAESLRRWRNHGQEIAAGGGSRDFVLPGLNYRMTEVQAAIGRVQMEKLPELLSRRQAAARLYLELLADLPAACLPASDPEHTWQTFMICLRDGVSRDAVVAALAREGIGAGAGSVAGHCGRVFRERLGYEPDALPVSLRLHRQGLALPLYSTLTPSDQRFVCEALRRALE